MDILNSTPIIAFETADTFETWLETNHASSTGIWLKIFKKKSFDEKAFLQKLCSLRAKSIGS